MTKKRKKVEVLAIVATARYANQISDRQLFELSIAFGRMLKMYYSPKGELIIYSYNGVYQERLEALLPFMPHFGFRRVVVDEQNWQEAKLEEALRKALT